MIRLLTRGAKPLLKGAQPFLKGVQSLLRGAQSLLFPATCAGCSIHLGETATDPLCSECLKRLPRSRQPWCQLCGRSLFGLGEGLERCLECRRTVPAFTQAISPCRYEDPIRQMILALKYQRRLSLVPFLGTLLIETVRERLEGSPLDAVVPVPLHPTRLRERTFNPSEVLAQFVAVGLSLPLLKNGLLRCKPTATQTALTRAERVANVRNAFVSQPTSRIKGAQPLLKGAQPLFKGAEPLFKGLHLLLLDDVFTTGATAAACANVLKRSGSASITVVTIAHGE